MEDSKEKLKQQDVSSEVLVTAIDIKCNFM